jgi:hypothetical protein
VQWLDSDPYGPGLRVRDIGPDTPGVPGFRASGLCELLRRPDRAGRPVVLVRTRRHDPAAATLDEATRFVVHW